MRRTEIIFTLDDGWDRCHATIVDELPEKTNRFSNGYGFLFRAKGGYDIYSDRDDHTAFGYYAVRKGE